VIKTIGDAIMASYPSAQAAVHSAVTMQKRLLEHNTSQPESERIQVRMGINHGRVLMRADDLFGDVVNAAARIESLAVGGQILISKATEIQLGKDFKTPRRLFDAVLVKGKKNPVEVFEVHWDPEKARQPETPLPGFMPNTVVGQRFEILTAIGEGGMGQVYEAHDQVLDEIVALKFIRTQTGAAQKALALFKSEVKLARAITHPNICRIHEFLKMDGHVFLSMELIRGRTLSSLLKKGTLTPTLAVTIAQGICQGLQAAHDRGIVHRDLKPENIMIEHDSQRVVLMDFGIAQMGRARSADEGMMVGTPEYMAPEQVSGKAVGPSADIYALGVILYEMLSGQPPYLGDTPIAVALRHVSDRPKPLAEVNRTLPARLTHAADRCLSKDPKHRFPSAHALELFVTGKQKKRMWILSAVFGAGLLAGLIHFLSSPQGPAAQDWQARLLVSSQPVDMLARYSPDGRSLAFIRNGNIFIKTDDDTRKLTQTAWALEAEGLAGLDWTADGTGLWYTINQEPDGLGTLLVGQDGETKTMLAQAASAHLSPDGKRLAFAELQEDGGFNLVTSRPDGTEKRILIKSDPSRSYLQPRWSPTGRHLALTIHHTGHSSTRDIAVFDLDDNSLHPLTHDGLKDRANNTDPCWTPDGKWILYASNRIPPMSLWQVAPQGGRSDPVSRGNIDNLREPEMAPDASNIVFASRKVQVDISMLDIAKNTVQPITSDAWPDRFPVFSPDGKHLAFRSRRQSEDFGKRTWVLFDLASQEETQRPAPAGLRDFCWCGSNAMAFAATTGTERYLGWQNLSDNSTEKLSSDFSRIWSPTCSPDGKQVVFVAQKNHEPRHLWLFNRNTSTLQRLTHDNGTASYPAYSPQGNLIAYRWAPSEDRWGESELRVMQPQPGSRQRTVSTHHTFKHSQRRIRFSADGNRLFYMEAIGRNGQLWWVPIRGGRPRRSSRIKDIHIFDYDLAPGANRLVYPRVSHTGDLFILEKVD
jgi:serine/threonine protein kinase/Tol biopolymer transport system component